MKPRALVIAAICLASPLQTSFAGDRWCGDRAGLCPQTSHGWMLFVDENHGAPDFWWTESVTVREMFICAHGVQFLFVVEQRGQPHYAALVFPKPSERMLAERLKLTPGSEFLRKELQHFQWRYTTLVEALESISGGLLVEGVRLSFENATGEDVPVIIPNRKLVLKWCGEELKLRGYLDVYFTLVS